MNNASMTFGRPTRLAAPRASIWLARIGFSMINGLRSLKGWQFNQQHAEPKTAEDVLRWAQRIEAADPGFASDLRAAAMRSIGQDQH